MSLLTVNIPGASASTHSLQYDASKPFSEQFAELGGVSLAGKHLRIHKLEMLDLNRTVDDTAVLSLFGFEQNGEIKLLGRHSGWKMMNYGDSLESHFLHHMPCPTITVLEPSLDTTLYFRTLAGKTVPVPTNLNATVQDLKLSYMEIEGTPPDQQRLIYSGKQLEDDRLLSDYNIGPDCTLHLVLRLRGGMYHMTSGRDGAFADVADPLRTVSVRIGGRTLNLTSPGSTTLRDICANLKEQMKE